MLYQTWFHGRFKTANHPAIHSSSGFCLVSISTEPNRRIPPHTFLWLSHLISNDSLSVPLQSHPASSKHWSVQPPGLKAEGTTQLLCLFWHEWNLSFEHFILGQPYIAHEADLSTLKPLAAWSYGQNVYPCQIQLCTFKIKLCYT
jgi:hypothetical protein